MIHNKGISKISSCLLISMAMIAALMIGDLFAAGEVAFIMEIGALLEDMTTERARKGLKNLIALTPETGRLWCNGQEKIVPIQEIKAGDIIRILPGETIPLDGVIISGETSVDQSVMTGESLPIDKGLGDSVYSGTLNRFGSIDIQATKVGEDSSLQKLIHMVEEAEQNQAPTQRIADRWASWLVPVALGIAILAFLVTGQITRAVTVMVVFCPCALVLATPTAIMAAIGQATKNGLIIKSGQALEEMGKITQIALDKTGTLTYGRLAVSDMILLSESLSSEEELLRLAASAEARSEHPLGKAITEKARLEQLSLEEASSFTMTAGRGIKATIGGKEYFLGNEAFLTETGVADMQSENISEKQDPDKKNLAKQSRRQKLDDQLAQLRKQGKASVIVADQQKLLGIIALADILRPEAAQIMKELADMNVKTVLLTGDHLEAAQYYADQAGISQVKANLLPQDKVKQIELLKKEGPVCMIGDGVNDAPALKLANVGVAMGAMGSDIAVEAADIALMTDDIKKLPYMKWLSNTTVKTIKTAITLSMCINFVAIILSVTGVLTPTTGALVHNAGSCFVVLLAALLYDRKYKGVNQ